MAEKRMQKLDIKKGALRKALHVKEGKKIPTKKLAVKKSDSPLMVKRKTLAKTFSKSKH